MNSSFLIVSAFLCCTFFSVRAQDVKPPQPSGESIQAQKLSFIIERMELSPEELKAFLPIYKQQQDKLRTTRRSVPINRKLEELSDDETEAGITATFAREEKLLEVRKDYFIIFKSILPIKKVAKLYLAEKEFNGDLLTKLQNKSAQR